MDQPRAEARAARRARTGHVRTPPRIFRCGQARRARHAGWRVLPSRCGPPCRGCAAAKLNAAARKGYELIEAPGVIETGMILPLMRAAALGAGERRHRDRLRDQ